MTPYLILPRGFRRRLQRLCRQGVDIAILTNSLASTDVPLVHGAYERYRGWLLRRGIRVAEFDDASGSLHAKLILLGSERALFGSLNLDPRSLFLNTELMLHLHCPQIAEQLQQWFAHWQTQANPDLARPQSWSRRFVARLSDWLPLQRWL